MSNKVKSTKKHRVNPLSLDGMEVSNRESFVIFLKSGLFIVVMYSLMVAGCHLVKLYSDTFGG